MAVANTFPRGFIQSDLLTVEYCATQHRSPTALGRQGWRVEVKGPGIVTADFIKGANIVPHHHGTVLKSSSTHTNIRR
jgi:hypothetical protein